MKRKSVIIVGGGTGGHLMPAIAIAEILKESYIDPILLTDLRCKKYLPDNLEFDHHILDVQRPVALSTILKFVSSWISSFAKVISLIRSNDVKAIIGCGGYVSIPVILAAIIMRRKLILHEQNAYVGRTNYFFSYIANYLMLSFMHTVNLPLISNKRFGWIGIPIMKKHREKALKRKKPLSNKKKVTILIIGGSQGAAVFDEVVLEAMRLVSEDLPNIKFKIIQQVREQSCEKINKEYQKLNIEANIANFFHNIEDYFSIADMVISRAGASTVNEITNYGIPAVLIPYPYAKNNHQYYNAMNLVKFNAAYLIDQRDLNPQRLSREIFNIINNKEISSVISRLYDMRVHTEEILSALVHKIIDK